MSITDTTDDTKTESTVCGTTNKDHQPTSNTDMKETKKAASVNLLPPGLDLVGATLNHSSVDLESMALGQEDNASALSNNTAAPSSNFAKTAGSFEEMKKQKRMVNNRLSLDGDIGTATLNIGQ